MAKEAGIGNRTTITKYDDIVANRSPRLDALVDKDAMIQDLLESALALVIAAGFSRLNTYGTAIRASGFLRTAHGGIQ